MTAMDNFVSKCVIVNTVNVIPLMVPACVILDGKERSATEVNSPMWEYICLTSVTRANRRRKWNFPLNFRTMPKLSELYSGIFQNY